MFKVTQKAAVIIAAAVSLCAGNALGAAYEWSNTTTAANLGPETYIDSTGQIDVYCGTVNINEGAFLKLGGNSDSTCNYIGVDRDANAAVNINGGTLWCAKSNGSGYLGIGINGRSKAYTATLTLNSGTLKVDGQIRSAVGWNSAGSVNKTGTVTINGGIAEVGQFVLGSTSGGNGSSVLNLNGGSLTLNELYFRACNGQTFTWGNGTLVAGKADIFRLENYSSVNGKTRTMQITGWPSTFDTAGYAQSIPAFTGTGALRLTGSGTVTFQESTLSYCLMPDGVTIDLGALNASSAPLTIRSLEITAPFTLAVSLPASPSGRYPVIATTAGIDGSLERITVSGGGAGVLVRDGNTLYLSFDGNDALVYSAAAGGADTPAETSYSRLVFADTAGSFTVGGDGLTLSYDISDASTAAQTITAPITFANGNRSAYVAEGGKLTLSGGTTAQALLKEGKGTLVLGNATMPTTLVPTEGTIDFGGNTYTGTLNLDGRLFDGERIVLTNGTYNSAGNFKGSTVVLADGFTMNTSGRIAMGYVKNDEAPVHDTTLVIDGGTLKVQGNNGNTCNFIGVDKSGTFILELKRGVFEDKGWLRIAAGGWIKTGIVRVSGGTFSVANDVTMGSIFNGTDGNHGYGMFEQSGGTASVGTFYVGNSSSTEYSSSTLNLTGGVLEVGTLKCLQRNRQAIIVSGGTIKAKRDATSASPFMAKVASADSYAKTYTIGTGGLTVDTAGYAVGCDIPWSGTGGITIDGDGGSLLLAGDQTFAGDITIAAGAALVVTNSYAFAGKIAFGANAKLKIDTTSYTEDSLTIATDGFTLPEGADDVLDFVELVGDGYMASVSADGKSIELSLAANVAAFAWWTGGGDPTDLDDPGNWACTNSTGGVVANALPVKSTVVVVSGTTSFSVPAGTTPVWATTQIGNGGGVALGTDCDWSAAPNLTIADGSYLDLCGHNLKISYLTAAEGYDGAYVTNSVAGTKPALWAENVFTEGEYIDTAKVTVFTDNLEVKGVNYGTFTTAGSGLANAFDASVVVTSGVTTVSDWASIGRYNHSAMLAVSNNATLKFNSYVRTGFEGTSVGNVIVADNANFNVGNNNHMTIGHHNAAECVFTQEGGTVTVGHDMNIGVGNTATSRYEIASGSLTVTRALVTGRNETNPGYGIFVQRGGTVKSNTYLTIGYGAGSEGFYFMSGGTCTITANRANLGSEGAVKMGLWDISGGTATTAKGLNVAQASGSTAKLRLSGSGKLVTADITGGAGASTVEFDGGTLAANADNAAFIKGITNIVFGANAVTLDTAGHNLGITNCVLKVTPGAQAITLTGGGALDFTNTTLDFTEPLNGGFVLAKAANNDAATFANAPALAPGVKGYKVKRSADGKTIKVMSKGFIIIVK